MIVLSGAIPIASGLFRDCYRHPDNPALCIKVARIRPAHEPDLRRHAWLRPLRLPNELEYEEYRQRKAAGVPLERYLPRLHGFVATDRGPGLCVDLLQSDDGTSPVSIENYLAGTGRLDGIPHAAIQTDYAGFADFCVDHAILASSDELSNVGYVRQNGVYRFIVFDMKHRQNLEFIPVSSFIQVLRRRKIRRRFNRSQAKLERRLAEL